jgi:hypothetical protein
MKLILSRKGFDSSSGGGPSPIVDGCPLSLPIPASDGSATCYADLGLGELAQAMSRGRVMPDDHCHHDPMFVGARCLFGQHGAAQSHLAGQGVGIGDIFLFFGLFRELEGGAPHHRIYGYLKVEALHRVAELAGPELSRFAQLGHPHVLGDRAGNDVIYSGEGRVAGRAHDGLRLTRPGAAPSSWFVPEWLGELGLSYHAKPSRWGPAGQLQAVSRGQEFVCDVGNDARARSWIEGAIDLIRA